MPETAQHKSWLRQVKFSVDQNAPHIRPLLALLAMPTIAHAQTVSGGASPQTMINNVCTFVLGPFGESLAVLALIAIGLLFMFGRASVGVIAGIVGGIVIMFGASYLGQTLTGG